MKIYFLARFDLNINVNENVISLRNDEIALLDEMYDGDIFVESKDIYLNSYSFTLQQCMNSEHNFINFKKLVDNSYLLELKPNYIYLPNAIQKHFIEFENEIYCVETNCKWIQIYTPNYTYFIQKQDLISFNYEIKTINKKILFLIFNFERDNYYYIFNSHKLMYGGILKEVNIKDNHLIVLNDYKSCYGQKRVIDFNIKDNTEENYLVYNDDRSVFTDINILYLFLDALKIKNYDLCKQYLSGELCEIDKECFFEFFKDFDEYRFIDDSCIIEKNNEVIKIVHFEVFNNKILNIYD